MPNVGQHIVETQDQEHCIDYRLAAYTIYSKAKFWRCIQFVLAFPLPLALAFICNSYPTLLQHKGWILALFSVGVTVINLILEKLINREKKVAASIQELFDTQVLNIEENTILDRAFIDTDLVRRYSKKARNNTTLLSNATTWYDQHISNVASNMASLLCQRTNINYDFSLRSRYQKTLVILSTITLLGLLCIALKNNLSVQSLLIEVLLPGLPLLMFSTLEIFKSKDSIDNLRIIKQFITDDLNDGAITAQRLRQIQDRIFAHRLSTPLIPNFVYQMMRSKLEDEMSYSIESYVSKTQSNAQS